MSISFQPLQGRKASGASDVSAGSPASDSVAAMGREAERQRAWILALLLGLTAYFVQGLFNNFLYLDSGRFSVFLMLALLQAAYGRSLPAEA